MDDLLDPNATSVYNIGESIYSLTFYYQLSECGH